MNQILTLTSDEPTIKLNNQLFRIMKYKEPDKHITPLYIKSVNEFKQSSGIFKVKIIPADSCKEMYSVTIKNEIEKTKQVFFIKILNDDSIQTVKKYRSYETELIETEAIK